MNIHINKLMHKLLLFSIDEISPYFQRNCDCFPDLWFIGCFDSVPHSVHQFNELQNGVYSVPSVFLFQWDARLCMYNVFVCVYANLFHNSYSQSVMLLARTYKNNGKRGHVYVELAPEHTKQNHMLVWVSS